MKTRFYSAIRLPFAVCVALALVLVTALGAPRADAADTDLSGTWNTSYLLSCTAVLTQSGSAVSGAYDCGNFAFSGPLEGTYSNSTLALTGYISDAEDVVTIVINATVAGSGSSMTGTVTTVPPIIAGVSFEGQRAGAGSANDVTGSWTLLVSGVFAGTCTVQVQQAGSTVQTLNGCGNVPALQGTYDDGTRQISLQGTVFGQALSVVGTVSSDARSIDGTWRVDSAGERVLGGAFLGERQAGPAPTSTSAPSAAAAATATVVRASLPPGGSGPGDANTASPFTVVTMVLGGAAVLLAGVRLTQRRGR